MNKPLVVASMGSLLGVASCLSLWDPFLQSVPDNADLGSNRKGGLEQPSDLAQRLGVKSGCVSFAQEENHDRLKVNLYGIWGAAASQIWAVGQNGTILRRTNEGMWTTETNLMVDSLYAVWGTSANDVWAVGDASTVLRYDGANWSKVNGPQSQINLSGVWRSDSGSNLWVTGDNGYLANWAEGSWHEVSAQEGEEYFTIWGRSASSFLLAGRVLGLGKNPFIRAAEYSEENETWMTTDLWTGPSIIRGIWGPSVDMLWAVGDNGTILVSSSKDTTWTPDQTAMKLTTNKNLYSIYGLSENDVWVVGESGTILRYKNQGWSDCSLDGSEVTLRHVWAADAQNIWIVGDRGVILHSQ